MSVTAAVDLRDPARVAAELAEAGRRLGRSRSTPAAVSGLVRELAAALAAGDELAGINPWVWIALQRSALRAQAALLAEDPGRRAELRLALEQMRFLLARLAEREPIGDGRPAGEVARWLERALPTVAQAGKAALVGVSPRTFQRWVSAHEPTAPRPGDEARLRLVARLVNQLRHSLTDAGVVDWFGHPRADLGGSAPADLLGEPSRLEALLAAAAASRGSLAA